MFGFPRKSKIFVDFATPGLHVQALLNLLEDTVVIKTKTLTYLIMLTKLLDQYNVKIDNESMYLMLCKKDLICDSRLC